MNKPTIETALLQRIPLPWRQSTCDGPTVWKVERQRPEDFTAEIYQRLKKYGIKEDDIRVLFYIKNEDYARLKQEAGAKILPGEALRTVAPKDRPRIEMGKAHAPTEPGLEDVFYPADHVTAADSPAPVITPNLPWGAKVDPAENADGLSYQDRHNLRIHSPTETEIEDVFRPEDELPIPFVPVELIDFSAPLAPSAKIQITCQGYSLKQLKSILTAMPDETVISGTIHISL